MFKYDERTALIIVDMQKDFMPGGSLAVNEGDTIIPYINSLIDEIEEADGRIVYSADWHPANHSSFTVYGGMWPEHCVQFSDGALFHSNLDRNGPIFYKGFDPKEDSYSAFGGKRMMGAYIESLDEYLKWNGIKKVVIVGLALDFCIKATALDAVKNGYMTLVDMQGTKAVFPDEQEKVMKELVDGFVMVLE